MTKLTEKVKIFSAGNRDEFSSLESEVNTWLEQHPSINIVSRKVAGSSGKNELTGEYVNCTIVVFYTEG